MIEIHPSSSIYFVCSGNIIRSAFAEIYARSVGILNVASFGTRYFNNAMHHETRRSLQSLGIPPSMIEDFKPQHIHNMAEFSDNSTFFVMTEEHKQDLLQHNIANDRIIKLTTLIGKDRDITDPYFTGNYRSTFDVIRSCVDKIQQILKNNPQ